MAGGRKPRARSERRAHAGCVSRQARVVERGISRRRANERRARAARAKRRPRAMPPRRSRRAPGRSTIASRAVDATSERRGAQRLARDEDRTPSASRLEALRRRPGAAGLAWSPADAQPSPRGTGRARPAAAAHDGEAPRRAVTWRPEDQSTTAAARRRRRVEASRWPTVARPCYASNVARPVEMAPAAKRRARFTVRHPRPWPRPASGRRFRIRSQAARPAGATSARLDLFRRRGGCQIGRLGAGTAGGSCAAPARGPCGSGGAAAAAARRGCAACAAPGAAASMRESRAVGGAGGGPPLARPCRDDVALERPARWWQSTSRGLQLARAPRGEPHAGRPLTPCQLVPPPRGRRAQAARSASARRAQAAAALQGQRALGRLAIQAEARACSARVARSAPLSPRQRPVGQAAPACSSAMRVGRERRRALARAR